MYKHTFRFKYRLQEFLNIIKMKISEEIKTDTTFINTNMSQPERDLNVSTQM